MAKNNVEETASQNKTEKTQQEKLINLQKCLNLKKTCRLRQQKTGAEIVKKFTTNQYIKRLKERPRTQGFFPSYVKQF